MALGLASGITTAVLLSGRINRSFDYDESIAISTIIERGSVVAPLTETHVFNNHPIFALGQSVWWALGGAGEARQRLLPILYGALAVGLIVWWVARRWSPWSAVAAGAVVMLNPMFVTQARAVRGYSLVVLGVVVSLVAVLEYSRRVRQSGATDRADIALLVAHGAGAVVAVGTHSASAVAFAAIGVGLLVGRLVDRRLLVTWAVAILTVALVYLPTAQNLRETAEERGSSFQPEFGRLLTWEMLGRDRLTGVIIAGTALAGVVVATLSLSIARTEGGIRLRRGPVRPAPAAGAGVAVAAAWIVWQIVEPADLFPRFFLGLLPLIALAVARFVRLVPAAVVMVVAAMFFTVPNVLDARDGTVPLRDVAALTLRADDAGLKTCVVGGGSLGAYRERPAEFRVDPDLYDEQFATCHVVVRIGSWGRVIAPQADDVYEHHGRLGGIDVWASVPLSELGL